MGSGDRAAQSRVLTVSATYGAGGSVLAPALAARLDLPFFDRLLHGPDTRTVARVLERLSDEEREQVPPSRVATNLGHMSSGLGLPVPDPDDLNPRARIRREVEANIGRIAGTTGGVILGRSAAVVLGKGGCAFHVRLDGPLDRRCAQGASLEGVDETLAHQHQKETDRAWRQFTEEIFGRDPADPTLYHLVIDSTVVPLGNCVALIADAAVAAWERALCR
jgi:cytidylate kinase